MPFVLFLKQQCRLATIGVTLRAAQFVPFFVPIFTEKNQELLNLKKCFLKPRSLINMVKYSTPIDVKICILFGRSDTGGNERP